MNRYALPQQTKAVYESLRQAFAVYQVIDKRVVTLALSDGFCRLFGYEDRAQAYDDMDHDMYKDAHPDDVARISNAAAQFAMGGERYEAVYRTRRRGSSGYMIVHAMGERVYTEDGTRLAHVWYTDEGNYSGDSERDQSELTKALSSALHEQSMVKASQYDYLTGLPNMTYFFELSDAGKDAILRKGGEPMLLYMDFSGMKFFNTNFGFAEGDRMLQSFARIIARVFGSENCCRIGADHFAAISEETGLEEKLKGIFHEFGGLYDGKTPPVHVGIYSRRVEDVPSSTACDRAKFACSIIKRSYTSRFNYYSNELRDEAVLRRYIVENIDTAISEKWIQVYLQPIIRAVNGRVCDAEALARWVDPERGVLSPASFIPALERAGLIYKLDLYMVDQVLEAIKAQQKDGFFIVPHSINLSRSDFDACDIVEEIRRRVDAAGISRDRITVEVTESVIGRDFEFMKSQIERFRQLGFQVWLDDFGSGYSSLEVLQSVKFDLIKFDMSFMRRLDEGDNGKITLTELMRLATALGVETVSEGVETEAQIRFLQEIGCSKLQGYYYSRPLTYETIRELRRSKTLLAHENPEESAYYESISRVNLFDLGVVASDQEDAFQNVFETIPIAVLEITGDKAGFVRFNRSYQDYVKRFFSLDIQKEMIDRADFGKFGSSFNAAVKQCCENGSRIFFDEKMPDGSVVHLFVRRVSVNPVTGGVAVAIAVLSVTDPKEGTTYAEIARTLATDYYNIFVIDLDTDAYVEYSSRVGGEELSVVRHGEAFFESAQRETMTRIYEEDREPFLKLFTKEEVLRNLDRQGVFTTTYRVIDTGTPMYVNMKITRMHGGNRAILGVSVIDAHMKQLEEEKKLRREKASLGRIAALAPHYIVLYTVDPVSGNYTQYSPSREFARFGLARQGEDFFADVILDAPKAIAPEDMERHLRVLTKENMLREIRENGSFIHHYRLMLDGGPVPVTLRAVSVEENDGEKIILGVTDDGEEKRRTEEAGKREDTPESVSD